MHWPSGQTFLLADIAMSGSRVISVEGDEPTTIMVRTDRVVTLVFGRMQLEVFEKDGRLYTIQGISEMENTQTEMEEDYDETQPVPGDTQLETQPWDYETPPDDTDLVIKFAGGTFTQVNEKHAARLEMSDLKEGLDTIAEELSFTDAFGAGETQLEDYGDSGSETEDESDQDGVGRLGMYTRSGLYIPSYLR